MEHKWTLGIDNGQDGGLVLLGPCGGIESMEIMPSVKLEKGRKLNITRLIEIMSKLSPSWLTVVLERPTFSKSARAAMSMYEGYGTLLGLFTGRGFKVVSIKPSDWQKPMLKAKTGDTKPAALRLAKELWPQETWLATARSKVAHSGLVDAAIIAEYGRRNNL